MHKSCYYTLSYCGVRNPSWSEVHHFVKFFDLQLQSCENSVFLDPHLVRDVLGGMKSFVVKFMIRMSKVSLLFAIVWPMLSIQLSKGKLTSEQLLHMAYQITQKLLDHKF